MNEQSKNKSTEQIKQTKQMKEITSNIVAYENRIIEHLQAVTNLMVEVKKEHEELQLAQGNIENNIVSQGVTNVFMKTNVQKNTNEVNQLKKEVKELQKALNIATRDKDCALSALETQQVYTNEIINAQKEAKEKEEAKLKGIQEKKNKARQRFIEYIHNYLNSTYNKGDNRVYMPQLLMDLKISEISAIRYSDEIATQKISCGYEDVLKWAKSKGRFRRRK